MSDVRILHPDRQDAFAVTLEYIDSLIHIAGLLRGDDRFDQRLVAIGGTQIELGCLALKEAVKKGTGPKSK